FRRAITNGAGRFDVRGAPPGRYRLFARRRDQTDDDGDGVIVHSGDRDVKLVLPDITTITGRVLLEHKPVTYFGVVVSDRGEQHWRGAFPVAFRAASGRFTQRGVPAGDRNIVIVGPGFARHILDVRIPEGKQLDLGDIEVERGQVISGRVTDASGAPVASATVLVEQNAPILVGDPDPLMRALGGGAIAITDANGMYSMAGIAAPPEPPMEWREFNQISARHPERGTVPVRTLAPTESNVDFVLAASGGIDGVVEGPLGSLTYVVIQHDNSSDTKFGPLENRKFRFDNLPAGNYTLALARSNGDGFKVAPLSVTVVANQRITAVFKLPPSVTLAIHVPDGTCEIMMLVPPGTSPPPTEPRSASGFAHCAGADAIIEGVLPGSYRACLPSGRCAPVTVAPSPARQTFEFPAK
ncbi:MAG: hypothetical protein HOV81_33000, partial [Kofleriaceae bacterium]|nr:hypothetical protein [Kofleriaceae bacterium]